MHAGEKGETGGRGPSTTVRAGVGAWPAVPLILAVNISLLLGRSARSDGHEGASDLRRLDDGRTTVTRVARDGNRLCLDHGAIPRSRHQPVASSIISARGKPVSTPRPSLRKTSRRALVSTGGDGGTGSPSRGELLDEEILNTRVQLSLPNTID